MALMVSAALAAGTVSCSKGPEIIPKRQMEKIYHDMFLADQWLADVPGKRPVADTTWFYQRQLLLIRPQTLRRNDRTGCG